MKKRKLKTYRKRVHFKVGTRVKVYFQELIQIIKYMFQMVVKKCLDMVF